MEYVIGSGFPAGAFLPPPGWGRYGREGGKNIDFFLPLR